MASLSFYENGDVLVGAGKPEVAIFQPSEKILGAHYGSELAMLQKNNDRAVLVSRDFPQNKLKKLLICSVPPEGANRFNAEEVIFLNVPPPDDLSKNCGAKITAVVGGFVDWRVRRAWEAIRNSNKYDGVEIHILVGVADYIPNWTRFILDEAN